MKKITLIILSVLMFVGAFACTQPEEIIQTKIKLVYNDGKSTQETTIRLGLTREENQAVRINKSTQIKMVPTESYKMDCNYDNSRPVGRAYNKIERSILDVIGDRPENKAYFWWMVNILDEDDDFIFGDEDEDEQSDTDEDIDSEDIKDINDDLEEGDEVDIDGDGTADGIFKEKRAGQYSDLIFVDTNGDGIADTLWQKTSTGLWIQYIDTNYNGVFGDQGDVLISGNTIWCFGAGGEKFKLEIFENGACVSWDGNKIKIETTSGMVYEITFPNK